MSLCSIKVVSRGTARSKVGPESVIDLASDVALQAAHNFALGTSFERTPCSVGSRTCAISKAWDGDHVQSRVCGSIAVRIQTVASGLSGGRRNRIGGAQMRERSLATQAIEVLLSARFDEPVVGV